jgi:hypothetical protein
MGWFSKSDEDEKTEDHRRRGFDGPIDQNGDAVMGRNHPDGRARGMFDGGDGYGQNGEPRYNGRRRG